MIELIKSSIQDSDTYGVYNLNYPTIINVDNKIINIINHKILEDVKIFKDVYKNDIKNILKNTRYLYYISSEYNVFFNSNNIFSISLELCQLVGIYNINYIKSYNYDISLEKEIKLTDLFKNNIDYKKFINNLIKKENNIDIEIYDEISFCFNNKELIIYFSSYEIEFNIPNISFILIDINLYKDYFSNYFINIVC